MIAFTICSNNYLAHAKTLFDSIKLYSPETRLHICLVDELSPLIDYANYLQNVDLILAKDLLKKDFKGMVDRYDIIELNTSVKPSMFKYLINQYPDENCIVYFDPDISVYSSLNSIETELGENAALLTPHINSPLPYDNLTPNDQVFLKHGIFNLGFFAINPKNETALDIIKWWESRCLNDCYRNAQKGLFVDQLWMNLVPLIFQCVTISSNNGLNMGPWNLHERQISQNKNNQFMIGISKLTFYHFSSYDYKNPDRLNKPFYNRFDFEKRPDLLPLYGSYNNRLCKNEVGMISKIECSYYPKIINVTTREKTYKKSRIRSILHDLTPPLIVKSLTKLKNQFD
jgi:hypothetical protein